LVLANLYLWIAGEEKLDHEEWDFEDFVKNKIQQWTKEENILLEGEGYLARA
jgi:hypothetical protein